MKRVLDVIIGTSHELNPNLVSNPLGTGEIALFRSDWTAIPGADLAAKTANAALEKVLHIAQYDAEIGTRISLPITKKYISSYKREVAVPASPQVVTISNINALNNTKYSIIILRKDDRNVEYPIRHLFEFTSDANATQPEIATGFTNINRNEYVNVTASVSTNDLVLTAKDETIFFEVILKEGFGPSVTKTVTPPNYGSGTYKIAREAEEVYKGYKGVLNRTWMVGIVSNPVYYSNPSDTYIVYTIEHSIENLVDPNVIKLNPITAQVYFRTGGAGEADFKALLESFVGAI